MYIFKYGGHIWRKIPRNLVVHAIGEDETRAWERRVLSGGGTFTRPIEGAVLLCQYNVWRYRMIFEE